MQLARVTGTVVATVKDPALERHKLLVVELLSASGRGLGKRLVALDAVGCGVGEIVYCCRSKESTLAFDPATLPCDLAIVGIVDAEENPRLFPAEPPAGTEAAC